MHSQITLYFNRLLLSKQCGIVPEGILFNSAFSFPKNHKLVTKGKIIASQDNNTTGRESELKLWN